MRAEERQTATVKQTRKSVTKDSAVRNRMTEQNLQGNDLVWVEKRRASGEPKRAEKEELRVKI